MQKAKDGKSNFIVLVSTIIATIPIAVIIYYLISGDSSSKPTIKDIVSLLGISIISLFIPAILSRIDEITSIKIDSFNIELKNTKQELNNEIAKNNETVSKELYGIKNSINQIDQRNLILSNVHSYLYSTDFSFDESYKRPICEAKIDVIKAILGDIAEYRSTITNQLINSTDEGHINDRRKKLFRIFPLLECIIGAVDNTDEHAIIHMAEAQMAYVMKDCYYETYNEQQQGYLIAYSHISSAIKYRDMIFDPNNRIVNYEFNRFILAINIDNAKYKNDIENDYNTVYNDIGARFMLFETSPIIAPEIDNWLAKNKIANMTEWKQSIPK